MRLARLRWKVVEGELIERARSLNQVPYCIYKLQSTRGRVIYASTPRCWEIIGFRFDWPSMPSEMLSDWQYFTTVEEARRSVGNLDNEERGIEPFEYDKTRYTSQPDTHYCPCCGYKTLVGFSTRFGYNKPPYTHCVCEICYWQDDSVQYRDPDFEGGANRVSLRQARKNFLEFGAAERADLPYVRKPNENDQRDPEWKLD